jgi:CoA-dependent NAD(P)H sulfur oxidoreductase
MEGDYMTTKRERLIVIGGVAAGMSAASAARRAKPDMEIIIFEKGPFISYGACSLPYYLSKDIQDYHQLIAISPEAARDERGLDVRSGCAVSSIDVRRKEVQVYTVESGVKEVHLYDKLVLAMGAVSIRPPMPGIDLRNVFTLRTLEDGIAIRDFIDRGHGQRGEEAQLPRVVIIGGGYIGLELCESFRKRGLDVTVVEKMDRVLGTMDTSITAIVEDKVRMEGVKLFKETSVLGFSGREGAVTAVETDKGQFPAELVIVSVGVAPNTQIAKEAGVALGIKGAISVNEFMETNAPDIFAAGDCAEAVLTVTGKKTYIPLGTTANKQGRIAGENAAGGSSTFDGVVGTAQTKVFDLEVARTGLSQQEAEREGLDCFSSTIRGWSRSKAYPAGKPLFITYSIEKGTGRLLGAQMVGQEGVALRIDTLAACLYGKMTIMDVARLDLGYAPPFATVWDPILLAANQAVRTLQKGG